MVRVLDVLLHQLPVTGNALAAVAEDRELAAVEQAVEIVKDVGAQKVLERLDARVERREDHAAARCHLELVEAVVLDLEVGGHAAIHLAVLLDATAKGHALQIALERVVPLVVGADELLAIAMAL